MPSRAQDWYGQACRDLEHARVSLDSAHYDWVCFAAQQAAEKGLKALYQFLGAEARGHSVLGLLQNLPQSLDLSPDLVEAAKQLDKHYIPARYPNSYPQGAPYEYYTGAEAQRALRDAELLLQFCQDHLV